MGLPEFNQAEIAIGRLESFVADQMTGEEYDEYLRLKISFPRPVEWGIPPSP